MTTSSFYDNMNAPNIVHVPRTVRVACTAVRMVVKVELLNKNNPNASLCTLDIGALLNTK